MAKRKSTTA